MKKRMEFITRLIKSVLAFTILTISGFRISYYNSDNVETFELFRFYWNDKVIRTFPDIDCVDGSYYSIHNGHSEKIC